MAIATRLCLAKFGVVSLLLVGCRPVPEPVRENTQQTASAVTCDALVANVRSITVAGDPFIHRTGHSMAAVNDNVYMVRGVVDDFDTQTNTFPEDVVRFQPNSGHVKQMDQRGDAVPGGLAFSCMAADDSGDGALYLFGGGNYVFELDPDFFASLKVSDALWRYDVEPKRWTLLAPAAPRPTARNGCTAEFYRGAMYMFGGINRFFVTNNELWRFDTSGGTWTPITPASAAPSPRYKPLSALDAAAGNVYYYGGLSSGPEGFAKIDEFWVYDIASNTFRQLPSEMQPPRDQGVLTLLKGPHGKKYIVHVGGDLTTDVDCEGFPQQAKATAEVWAFDIESEQWQLVPTRGPMPRIEYHAGTTVNDKLYFAGGWAEEPDAERTCRKVWNERFYELSLDSH